MKCNINLWKLAHKSHIVETSLLTGAIPNQVRNSQTSRFILVPGQNPVQDFDLAQKNVGQM